MVGDVVESERNMLARQDVPDGDAEGGPRKLDEGEHGVYMTEAKRNRKRPCTLQLLRVFMDIEISKVGKII